MHAYIQGQRDRDLEKLSPAMWDMLWQANALGSAPYDVARLSTRRALVGKGLLTDKPPAQLTALGRRALLVEWRDPLALEKHLAASNTVRDAFAAMEDEQAAEYADYVRRCGGVPISHVKP